MAFSDFIVVPLRPRGRRSAMNLHFCWHELTCIKTRIRI
jgi:hypothetical protein